MSGKTKKTSKDKKKQKKRYNKTKKRTHKEAFANEDEYTRDELFGKKRMNKNEDNNIELINKNLLVTEKEKMETDMIYKNINCKNNTLKINMVGLNNNYYDIDFFDIIPILGDGNCFFRCISYFFYGHEYMYNSIRAQAYNYIKNNMTKFYDFCYIENNTYYINIEQGETIIKYVLDDYVESIQQDGFFAGFLEMNAISIIFNRPIVVLENNIDNNNKPIYRKVAKFCSNEVIEIDIKDIIFINYIKQDLHYQLLKPISKNIKDKTDKTNISEKSTGNHNLNPKEDDNIEKFNLDLMKSSKEKQNENKKEKNNINNISNIKENTNNTKPKIEINIMNNNSCNLQVASCENQDDNKKYNQKDSESNSDKNKINDLINSFNTKFELSLYKNIISYPNISLNKINDKNGDLIINIPKYPILVGNKIDLNYYSDIFRYLYITKYNLNLPKYPIHIIETKKEKLRENKKREFRRKAKKYYLDDNNKLYKLIGINNKSA